MLETGSASAGDHRQSDSASDGLEGFGCPEWLPFHRAAAALDWESLTPRFQLLLLFMMRTAGLGFLAIFLLLATVPIYLYWNPDRYIGLAAIGIGTVYCVGLGALTRWMHNATGADTPWKASFAAAGLLLFAAATTLAA
jgi:hypothetical protein